MFCCLKVWTALQVSEGQSLFEMKNRYNYSYYSIIVLIYTYSYKIKQSMKLYEKQVI